MHFDISKQQHSVIYPDFNQIKILELKLYIPFANFFDLLRWNRNVYFAWNQLDDDAWNQKRQQTRDSSVIFFFALGPAEHCLELN